MTRYPHRFHASTTPEAIDVLARSPCYEFEPLELEANDVAQRRDEPLEAEH